MIKTLKEFQYIDEDGKDQGANVRQKAKDIANLLQDESRLRETRRTRANIRDRLIGDRNSGVGDAERAPVVDPGNQGNARPSRRGNPSRREKDEESLRRASQEAIRAEDRRVAEERDPARAIRLSEEEELQSTKSLQDANPNPFYHQNIVSVAPSSPSA